MTRNFYHILGIKQNASQAEIRAAYVRLVKQHHPDIASDLPERLATVQEAYRCLMDSASRAAHDCMIADREQEYLDRQRRVARRLRRYDHRHPHLPAWHAPAKRSIIPKLALLIGALVAACAWRVLY